MNVKRTSKPAEPEVIEAEWEPVGPVDHPPVSFAEAVARDSERLGRDAHGVLDQIEALQNAGRSIASTARSLYGRIASDVRIGSRRPLGR